MTNFKKMLVADLRKELSSRGLATSGVKQELVDRLEEVRSSRSLSVAVRSPCLRTVRGQEGE